MGTPVAVSPGDLWTSGGTGHAFWSLSTTHTERLDDLRYR
ncbi:hypothetical protein TBK1r_41460 [Stieleria magnilauensis]|uniref:Uncharacterized protein n=1 Tax=Stieleria magnilauensis TaxID=2527963 RepID=A0ABX5XT66_9BACT|nr:hypothetical protein TBK1r_41460 [Planctomycetes bacterium TBK1r]